MIRTLVFMIAFTLSGNIYAQYKFKMEKQINCTPVKNQAKTGTCWSFATSSFIESELLRMGKGNTDVSEMYIVRAIYRDKARNYILRQGKANFSQGSLSHDLIRTVAHAGILPESAYSGLVGSDTAYDHSEMEKGLKGFLDGVRQSKQLTTHWMDAVDGILDAYMGPVPEQWEQDGKTYTADTYYSSTGLDPTDYISLTSWSHHPFYHDFILEIPDNYSNGSYYNIPIDELMSAVDYALLAGYSVAWDGDVSEKGFSSKDGLAILPTDATDENMFKKPVTELEVDQDKRQAAFENYSTTDDHLMHIVGIALDQNGKKYYLTKNSWGDRGPYEGYIYMSEAYVKMKTVGILLHKDAVPKKTTNKLKL